MGLFDRDVAKDEARKAKDEAKTGKADFSNVQSGSSSTAPAPAQAEQRTYTVEPGDTLWAIAARFYGNGNQWPRIHEANRELIQNPDMIQPGWVLTIPPGEGGER